MHRVTVAHGTDGCDLALGGALALHMIAAERRVDRLEPAVQLVRLGTAARPPIVTNVR
jgi:hypothetical protein